MKKSLLLPLVVALCMQHPATLRAALVLHYTFDDATEFTSATGDTISDSSGNGRDATEGPRNILWDSGGISGGAIDVRTNNTYFSPTVNLSAGLVPANRYTLVFWVKSADTNNFKDWGQVEYSDGQRAELRTLDANPNRGFYYRDTGPTPDWLSVNRGINLKDNEWHQIALVFSPIDNSLTTYLDGSNPHTITGNPRTNGEYVQSILIGRSSASDGPTGLMDDVQLYNIALSAEQVTFLYNNPGQVIPEPSVAALLALALGASLTRRRRGGR